MFGRISLPHSIAELCWKIFVEPLHLHFKFVKDYDLATAFSYVNSVNGFFGAVSSIPGGGAGSAHCHQWDTEGLSNEAVGHQRSACQIQVLVGLVLSPNFFVSNCT